MISRRSIFKSIVACVAASAMEVCGWKTPKIVGFDKAFRVGGDQSIESLFILEANRVMTRLNERRPNPWLALVGGGKFPEGAGHTLTPIVYEKDWELKSIGSESWK